MGERDTIPSRVQALHVWQSRTLSVVQNGQ